MYATRTREVLKAQKTQKITKNKVLKTQKIVKK